MPQKHHGSVEHYPVKRRGQKRRLDPNWPAIAWLEAESLADTEIVDTDEVTLETDGVTEIITLEHARGNYEARERRHYPRTMFQLIEDGHSSGSPTSPASPCPDCYDFSRSWNCPDHPEVPWGGPERGWLRPGRPDRAYTSPPAGGMVEALGRQVQSYANAVNLDDRLNDFWERQRAAIPETNPLDEIWRSRLERLNDFSLTLTVRVEDSVTPTMEDLVALLYEATPPTSEEGDAHDGQC